MGPVACRSGDRFIAISRTVQQRIAKYYRRDSEIIYPPVDTTCPVAEGPAGDYYLVVSRLVPYKRIDLVVKAFTAGPAPQGGGRRPRPPQPASHGRPQRRVPGLVSDAERDRLMAGCRAFIFPGEEDFGIAPLEATPVAGR